MRTLRLRTLRASLGPLALACSIAAGGVTVLGSTASTARAEAPADPRLEVLDAAFYVAKYPDLKAAFGSNVSAAQAHWLTYGIKEGRQSRETFSVKDYLERYPDLVKAFGAGNYPAALNHWLTYGKKEGRNPGPLVTFAVTLTNPGALGLLTAKLPDGGELKCGCAQGACSSACSAQAPAGTKIVVTAVPPVPNRLGQRQSNPCRQRDRLSRRPRS